MECETGGGSRRRLSDDGRDAWTGLTLGAVLGNDKRSGSLVQVSRTLLDIIRDEEPNSGAYKNLINHHNDKKNWKSFKDRLRLRRAGDVWTSSGDAQTSNAVAVQNSRLLLSRRNSSRMPATVVSNSGESDEDESEQVVCDVSTRTCGPQITRRTSTRVSSFAAEPTPSAATTESDDPPVVETVPVSDVPVQNSRIQMLRRNSSRLPSFTNQSTQSDPFNQYEPAAPSVRLSAALAAEREQIQRVVSSSEATAEAETENEVGETAEEAAAGQQPVRMSLMDLLEETDRQMGWVSYTAEEEEEEEEVKGGDDHHDQGGGGREYNCCVCMVRHKDAAFIPCGHTFCRLCSRELWVSRGNCPLCNGFILEILDIF